MSEFVRLEVKDHIATIRLDRAPMNPLNAEIQLALADAARECSDRRDIHAVVIYGGEKVFAAGADIKEMRDMNYTMMADWSTKLEAAFAAVAKIGKPTVAAVTGYALGGGCELAMCADFRVAGESAKLGQPEILLGVIPGAGGTQRLTRLVGPAKAKDLVFTGRMVKADEALAIGLVDKVVPDADVYTEAVALASRFVGGPTYAYRAAKEAIDNGLGMPLDAALEYERMQFASLFATRDRWLGMTSFIENGPGKAEFEQR